MEGKQPELAPESEPSWWQLALTQWGGLMLSSGVAVIAMVATWYLAGSRTGEAFRQMHWSWQAGAAVLAGVLILLLGLWMRAGDVQQRWHAFSSAVVTISPTLVKPLLVGCLGVVLTLCYLVLDDSKSARSLVSTGDSAGRAPYLLGILFLCSLPALLTTCVSLLIERRMLRGDFAFAVDPTLEASKAVLVEQVRKNWAYERTIMEGSIQRMGRHAAILGFLTSSIIATCAVINLRFPWEETPWPRMALAVGTAATISFTMHMAQIFFRSASNDATARMMAWGSRALLVVSICALFFSALGDSLTTPVQVVAPTPAPTLSEQPVPLGQAAASAQPAAPVEEAKTDTPSVAAFGAEAEAPEQDAPADPNPLRGRAGALLIGVAVALLGE
ncbi:hypothetical protein HPC49_50855, partial [Pyxidicoccus fallax]